jgi:hypothetical protein
MIAADRGRRGTQADARDSAAVWRRSVTRRVLVLVLGAVMIGSLARAEVSREPGFRVEWTLDPPHRERVTVSGYVYNERTDMVRYVQVRIQVVDAGGAVVAQRFHSVVGDIEPGGRAFFTGVVPAGGAGYRVNVASFQQLGGGGP